MKEHFGDDGGLLALMRNPPKTTVVLTITPEMAGWILGHDKPHKRNRAIKGGAVNRYAKDMAEDRWLLNGETIKFTDFPRLGDGQNRVAACLKAGVAFTTHVVFGIPDGFFFSMDQGRVRTAGDVLHLEGVKNATVVAGAVRWAQLMETGSMKTRRVFTPPEILDLYRRKHDGVRDFVLEARRITQNTRPSQPMALVAALLYHFDRIDTEMAAKFADAWVNGNYGPPFTALRRLHDRTAQLSKQTTGRIHEVVRAAMIVNTWNAYRTGKKGRLIDWSLDQKFPEVE